MLQSSDRIDPVNNEFQTSLTNGLLILSILFLIFSIICYTFVKRLRSLRSIKINIGFAASLSLASSLFLLQNLLVKHDNTGIIKLVCVWENEHRSIIPLSPHIIIIQYTMLDPCFSGKCSLLDLHGTPALHVAERLLLDDGAGSGHVFVLGKGVRISCFAFHA